MLGRAAVALWPTRGVPAGSAVGPSPHLVGLRARAVAALGRPGRLVVAGAPALSERVPAPGTGRSRSSLEVGQMVDADELVDRLVAMGYERVPQVEERGDLAVRGGLIDLYPSTADLPARIELFGDEVESLRAFSAFTQRTIRPVQRLLAWPAGEPAGADAADPLDDPAMDRAAVIRLAPGEHRAALAQARERLEDEAAAGALVDAGAVLAGLEARARLNLAPPTAGTAPVFDAVDPRFATRSATEAEAELTRLSRGGGRVLVAFARRGEMERALHRLQRVKAKVIEPGEAPAPGEVGFTTLPVRGGLQSRDLGLLMSRRSASCAGARRGPSAGRSSAGACPASWTSRWATTSSTRTTASAA